MLIQLSRPGGTPRLLPLIALSMLVTASLLPLSSGLHRLPARLPSLPQGTNLNTLPLRFEPNTLQSAAPVRFTARSPRSLLEFAPSGVQMTLQSPVQSPGSRVQSPASQVASRKSHTDLTNTSDAGPGTLDSGLTTKGSVHIEFLGANPQADIAGSGPSAATVNYFLGNDPAAWRTGLPTYAGITYSSLYPGIDLQYEGTGGELKSTYLVAPNADPSAIQWRYTGATSVNIDASGNLEITLANSELRTQNSELMEQAPIAWQEIGGSRVPVSAQYTLSEKGAIGFALGTYDPAYPLIIDPTLTYSTYLGGNFAETGNSIAVDPQGNLYVTGFTNSTNFPTVNPFQGNQPGDDVYVIKFNPAGQPIYSTYLGGSGTETGYGIATDEDGNAYISGFTSSTNFPVAGAYQPTFGGGFYDAFVTKLNPTGSAIIFSTYLGGSGEENSHGSGPQTGAIAVDIHRSVYVAGYTNSNNFPVVNPIQPTRNGGDDLYITKLHADGADPIWSTYLGGTSFDSAQGITVDSAFNVLVAGYSYSTNYPTVNAYQFGNNGSRDGIVTKINAAGTALIFSTYWGGWLDDIPAGVGVDDAGNVYIGGYTDSTDFPTINPFQPFLRGLSDAFAVKLTPQGTPLFATFLGGDWLDGASGVAVNGAGELFLMGSTQSQNFPLANPLYSNLRGSEDIFVTRFNAAGNNLVFSTYFGGSNNREMQSSGAIAIDSENNIYITGDTEATDFPTVNPFQPFLASPVDVFVSRISEQAPTATPTPAGTATPTPPPCIVGDYVVTQTTGATLVPGTTYLPNTTCDNCTAPIAFPFPVRFYDQTFTQGRVSSEGYLQFTGDTPLNLNFCLPYGGIENAIHAYWDDLYIGSSSWAWGIHTSISGSAPNRIFNIEWRGEIALSRERVNFEIRLFESGQQFEIIYALPGTLGQSATVGVQRDTGSRYTQFSCNQPLISQGLKLTFTLPACLTPTNTPQTRTPTHTPTATATVPTLLYSTYYGSDERDGIIDIGRDAAGNIYVAGTTFRSDIDFGNMYMAKFSPDGQQILYDVELGGTRLERAYTLAVDPAGNATIAGVATSNDYPTFNALQPNHAGGVYDVVLTKLNPQGSMIYSTYLGGNEVDYGIRLAADAAGNIYLTGETESTNFPTTANAFQPGPRGFEDGYVTKINPSGSALVWSTYLGGIYADGSYDLALDSEGNVYLTGHTTSPDFPTLNPFQPNRADSSGDAFVTKMNPQGTGIIYSTYLGGDHQPGPGEDSGFGIAVDTAGHAYVAGWTESPNFPTTLGSFDPYFNGYEDAFVTMLSPAGNALVYSTFLGGTSDERAHDIAVDGAGQAHVTGYTGSNGFPVVNAIQPLRQDRYDAFVTKLNVAGNVPVYSTFLGGDASIPFHTGDDSGAGILIDATGNAVIGGGTNSYNFPVVNAYQSQSAGASDGFISKISGSNPAATATPLGSHTATATPTITLTATPCGFEPLFFEGFEGGTLGAFTATAIPTDVPGWRASNTAGHTGQWSAFAPNHWSMSDLRLTTNSPIAIPANATQTTLTFWHRYVLEPGYNQGECTDGAVLELSTNGGATWVDAEPYITAGGYDGRIYDHLYNPLGGRMAWCGSRENFGQVVVNLQSFAGQNLMLRFRQGTDTSIQHIGWWVDDISISSMGVCLTATPTTTPPTATRTSTRTITTTPQATGTGTPGGTGTPMPCSITFTDVFPTDYFYEPVRYLYCAGVISGYADNTFRPYANTTRGQLAKIITLAEGWLIYTPPTPTFTDVPTTDPFYQYIETAYEQGIISGYSDGTFRPYNNVTRGQLTKIVVLAAGWPLENPPTPTFSDVPTTDPFYQHIETAYSHEIISGYADGTFRPGNPATRGQISKIVHSATTGAP